MGLILYDYELSAEAYKVRLMLALLGLRFEKRAVDVFPGHDGRDATFRTISPAGLVPVLIDGTTTISRSEDILLHLAAQHDPSGTWHPRDSSSVPVLTWQRFSAIDLAAAEAARLEALLRIPSSIPNAVAQARSALRTLEDHMVLQSFRDWPFLVGPRSTIADIAVFPAVALAGDFGCPVEEFPKLRAWSRRIRALPGFVAMPGIPEHL